MNERQIARMTRFVGESGTAIVISDHRKARPRAPGDFPQQAGKSYIGTCSAKIVSAFHREYDAVYDRR